MEPALGSCEKVTASPASSAVPCPALSPVRPSGDAPSPHAQPRAGPSFPKTRVLCRSDSKRRAKASQPRCPKGQYSRKPAPCSCSPSSPLPPQRETPIFQRAGGTPRLSTTQRKRTRQIASADVFTQCWFEVRAVALCCAPGQQQRAAGHLLAPKLGQKSAFGPSAGVLKA